MLLWWMLSGHLLQKCFPGLRVFDYSGGPRFFTKVVKQPYNKNGPIKELKLNATV
jgi:hypothetical protein